MQGGYEREAQFGWVTQIGHKQYEERPAAAGKVRDPQM